MTCIHLCTIGFNAYTHLHILSEHVCIYFPTPLLLQVGCSTDIQNSSGDTPLHIACEERNRDIVLMLVRSGARLDIKNKEDKTPLHLAGPELAHFITSLQAT